jgi:alginate O-acetyltransferase complex protein AlgI
LLSEKLVFRKHLEKLPKIIRWIITFGIVNVGWLLFRVNSINDLRIVLRSVFIPSSSIVDYAAAHYYLISYLPFIIVGVLFMFPFFMKFLNKIRKTKFGGIIIDVAIVGAFIVAVFAIISGSYNPFIYFRF